MIGSIAEKPEEKTYIDMAFIALLFIIALRDITKIFQSVCDQAEMILNWFVRSSITRS